LNDSEVCRAAKTGSGPQRTVILDLDIAGYAGLRANDSKSEPPNPWRKTLHSSTVG